MGGELLTPDLERELRELRRRAYGPDPDIHDDLEALSRLDELESARIAALSAPAYEPQASAAGAPRSLEQAEPAPVAVTSDGRAAVTGNARGLPRWIPASRPARLALVATGIVLVLALVLTARWSASTKPEASLEPTGIKPDLQVFSLVSAAPLAEVENSTLRGYEPYRGIEPWVAVGAHGSRCLLALERSSAKLAGVRCAPPEAELMLDLPVLPLNPGFDYTAGLAQGTVIRLQLRGATVDAYLFTPPETE